MPLAPGLLIRTLVRPGGRVTTVVIRRRCGCNRPAVDAVQTDLRVDVTPVQPRSAAPVPAAMGGAEAGFSRPVTRALAALGGRAVRLDRDGVALDGRRVPLVRMMAEANRCLQARGQAPIPYPGLRLVELR